MGPQTADDWKRVGDERLADARAMLQERPHSAGPVYMAGYAVECMLKAYCRRRNRPFPASGRAGHNLKDLYDKAGFRLCDLSDANGTRSYYVTDWSTDLRYEVEPPPGLSAEDLVTGAGRLVDWVRRQADRPARRRPR